MFWPFYHVLRSSNTYLFFPYVIDLSLSTLSFSVDSIMVNLVFGVQIIYFFLQTFVQKQFLSGYTWKQFCIDRKKSPLYKMAS